MRAITSFLFLASIFLSTQVSSQIYIQDLNLNTIKDVSIIEVQVRDAFQRGTLVHIDYGQYVERRILEIGNETSTILDKPGGNIIKFNSNIHVLNYFESNGWDLWDIDSAAQGDCDAVTSYYFKKK